MWTDFINELPPFTLSTTRCPYALRVGSMSTHLTNGPPIHWRNKLFNQATK